MYGRILYLNLVGMKQRHGADGGTRTHTLVRKGILSLLCLPFHHVSSYWAQPVIAYLEWDSPGSMGVTQWGVWLLPTVKMASLLKLGGMADSVPSGLQATYSPPHEMFQFFVKW